MNVCPLTFRYVRREKEIAETKCDLAVSESARFKQKCEQLSQQLQEAEETLRQERERTQVMGGGALMVVGGVINNCGTLDSNLKELDSANILKRSSR